MIDWFTSNLEQHVDLLTGFPFKSESFSVDPTDVPLVKGENLHQRYIDWVDAKRWNKDELNKFSKYKLEPDDIVLAMDRPWIEAGLKYAWIKKNDPTCLLVQRISRLRGKNGLETNYLRYIIGSPAFSGYIKNIVTGVNVPHISPSQILNFKFNLPPVYVQQKIVSILSAYDELIENNKQRIKLLEEMAEEIYKEWFVRFRFPGYESTKFFDEKKREVPHNTPGTLPEGWENRSFNKVAEYINGFAFKPTDWKENGIPIIKINELKNGIESATPRNDGQNIPEKYHVYPGDLLFSWSADLNVYIWNEGNGLLNQHIFKVIPNSEISKEFLFYSLKEKMVLFRGMSNGATMHHIKKSALSMVHIVTPSKSIMKKFQKIIEPILTEVGVLKSKNQILQQTRDLLLPRLINGKLSVEHLVNQEPAPSLTAEPEPVYLK